MRHARFPDKPLRKTAFQIISSDLIEFFPVQFDGERPRSQFEQEDGQKDSEKWFVMCHLAIMQSHASNLKCL